MITSTYCQQKTKTGSPCRAYAVTGSNYCWSHDPGLRTQRTQARQNGGTARHGRKILYSTSAPVTLNTIADVLKLLESEVNAVLMLEISLSRGQTIARLAGAFVSAFQVGEIEQRVALIEARLNATQPTRQD